MATGRTSKARMYSLFKVNVTNGGQRRFERISRMGLNLNTARTVWQTSLDGMGKGMTDVCCLRPINTSTKRK